MNPEISVIIINYNTYDLTCKCISSVMEKTHDISYEIVLVDNGSTEKEGEPFSELFPSITYIKSKKNLGFAGGNNLGIQYSKGNVVLLLNSDTELKNNAIKITHAALMKDNKIGVVSCKLLNYDGSIQKQCNRMESIGLEIIELFRLHRLLFLDCRGKLMQGSYFNHKENIYTDKVWGAYFMFKKNILNNFPNHQLHEDYFMYGEDVQWSYFIRKKLKKQILYVAEAELFHFGGGSIFKENKVKVQAIHRYQTLLSYYSRNYLKVYGYLHFINISSNKNKNTNTAKLFFNVYVKNKNGCL